MKNNIFSYNKKSKNTNSKTAVNINNPKIKSFTTKRDKKAITINDNFILYYQRDISLGGKRYICKEYYEKTIKCPYKLTLNEDMNILEADGSHNHDGNYEECKSF